MTSPSRGGRAAVRVVRCGPADLDDLARLRAALWPHAAEAVHRHELAPALAGGTGEAALFLARTDAGEAVGFAEAALRHEPVNGCVTFRSHRASGLVILSGLSSTGKSSIACRLADATGAA